MMGFRVVFTSVREAYVLNFSTTRTNMCLRVSAFPAQVADQQNFVYSQVLRRRLRWKDRDHCECKCDSKILSHHSDLSRPSFVHHEVKTSFSEMYFVKANDG